MAGRFYCHDCEKSFDEFFYSREYMGEFWGAPAYDTLAYCPYCKGDNYDEYNGEEDEEEEDEYEDE